MTFVPHLGDTLSDVYLNKINPEAENTFVIFKQSNIAAKFINLNPTPENFKRIEKTLDLTKGEYFNLPEPAHD